MDREQWLCCLCAIHSRRFFAWIFATWTLSAATRDTSLFIVCNRLLCPVHPLLIFGRRCRRCCCRYDAITTTTLLRRRRHSHSRRCRLPLPLNTAKLFSIRLLQFFHFFPSSSARAISIIVVFVDIPLFLVFRRELPFFVSRNSFRSLS